MINSRNLIYTNILDLTDLRGGVRTYVDVDQLPLSDTQKRLVLVVQGADTKKEAHMIGRHKDRYGRVLVTIRDIKGLISGVRSTTRQDSMR